ncbi:MAG: hypothetical protein VXW00_16175, partial [Candidatus Latescibacterota bacterium]|nr:hypothetical protein [Candidatus Latescibacterota bacterium]
MGPGCSFFRLIQTLPTFGAQRILILSIFSSWDFLDSNIPDFQLPDFQISRNLAWARLGPGWAGLLLGWPVLAFGPGGPSGGPLGWAVRLTWVHPWIESFLLCL